MTNTIVVIGEVRSDQYQGVRLECIRRGSVQIQSVRAEHGDFFLDGDELREKYPSLVLPDDAEDEDEVFAKAHLASYGEVVAIVMDEDAWVYPSDYPSMRGAIDAHDPAIAVWVVYKDGRTEIVSAD